MSLYGHKSILAEDDDLRGVDLKPFIEMNIYDDLSRLSDEDRQKFVQSEAAKVLMERQVLNKGTMVRLSKEADMTRRIKLNAYTLAKQANDPDYKKMCMYRAKWKMYRDKVLKKYANKATKVAKASQKEYIKAARSQSNANYAAEEKK